MFEKNRYLKVCLNCNLGAHFKLEYLKSLIAKKRGELGMTTNERRIRNNKIRRQRQLRRNIMITIITAVLIVIFSIGGFTTYSKAQDKESVVLYKYYTNIEVKYGETLWDIAETYFCEDKYKNYEHYITEVMQINGLYNEEVSAGSYLIVPYYSSEFK